jgi:energy-coupling factor transporter ATP-binding protein EcfA2
MSISKINEHFKLPIFYNEKKMELSKNIISDLELINAVDPSSCIPLYNYVFQPNSEFSAKVIEQHSCYYTRDKKFLKDTQEILSTFKSLKKDDFAKNSENKRTILEIWDEIKNDTGFKERYHYIDWPMWDYLNQSDYFLQIMSVYNLTAPVISLCVPFIILIIPFFVIQVKGLSITVQDYIEILKTIAANHAIGKLFTKFHNVKLDEKIYLLLSAAFYLFSIYQNVLTCWRFNDNMKKIHSYLEIVKSHIEETEEKMLKFLSISEKLKTYSAFNSVVKEKRQILTNIKTSIEAISPYKMSYKKIGEFGNILKCFYYLYNDEKCNDAMLYSFGFCGYVENLHGMSENIKNGYMNLAKFNKPGKSTGFKDFYYPSLMKNNPIKNSINFDKNIIITGPNASGKTTTLKTTLINIILSQQFGCGFYKKANLNVYAHVHCYLNIPDTSGRDSLFQAEARRCKEIINSIKKNSSNQSHFCVFDELYSGTNPEEAVISAHAFMTYLLNHKNVDCMLTTHFTKLCERLTDNPKIENLHMKVLKTDNDFQYTYFLEKGISTVRGGIKVLTDMNYPREIIENTLKSS